MPESNALARITSYPDLIGRLILVRDGLAGDQAQVHAWYAEQCAAATESVHRAEAEVAEAEAAVRAAETDVVRVDMAVHGLWEALGQRLSWRQALRRGPAPTPVVALAMAGDNPNRLLQQARARLASAPVVMTLAIWTYPVVALIGLAGTLALVRVALNAVPAGWVRLALVCGAPFVGLLPGHLVASSQHRARLDLWAILAVLLPGAVLAAFLYLSH